MDYYPAAEMLTEARHKRCFRNLDEMGQRIYFMVYPKSKFSKKGPLIIKIVFSEAGREIAKVIKKMIPICKYPKIGRKIMLFDKDSYEDIFKENEISFIEDGFMIGIHEIDYTSISISMAEF